MSAKNNHDALFEDSDSGDSDNDDQPAATATATKSPKDTTANKDADKNTSAYDEEQNEQVTDADKAFIADDDPANAGMLEEYNKQDQQFVEDERDDDFDSESTGAGRRVKPQKPTDEKLDRAGAVAIITVSACLSTMYPPRTFVQNC